jgi:dual specificity MAP kinase phosphatase
LGGLDAPLVIDVRSFWFYNKCHIVGSINITLPRALNRKRDVGLSEVEALFPDEDSKASFRAFASRSGVVVYDDGHADQTNRPALVLMNLLAPRTRGRVVLLEGGFSSFAREHPEACYFEQPVVSKKGPLFLDTSRVSAPQECEMDMMSEILPSELYLSSNRVAANLDKLRAAGVTHVLNMARECGNHFPQHFTYTNISIDDSSEQADQESHFSAAVESLASVLNSGGRVLVHCYAGVSRSTTAVLAYLVQHRRMSLKAAYDLCQAARPQACPNPGFMVTLIRHEVAVRGACSLSAPQYTPLLVMSGIAPESVLFSSSSDSSGSVDGADADSPCPMEVSTPVPSSPPPVAAPPPSRKSSLGLKLNTGAGFARCPPPTGRRPPRRLLR